MLTSSLDWLLALVLAMWLVLSAVNQFGPDHACWWSLKRFDVFGLLPRWTFFTPRPLTSDYHILYRDWDEKRQQPGEWKELALQERTAIAAFWNPQRRIRKALVDSIRGICRMAKQLGRADPAGYITLLQHVSREQPRYPGRLRQFAVVETNAFYPERQMRVLLESAFHRL
jgi:hypothetical protein